MQVHYQQPAQLVQPGPDIDVTMLAMAAAEKYADIQSYNNSGIISRYMKDYRADSLSASELFVEFKRFLAVCAACASYGTTAGMAGPVDDMWHTALLFTRDYREMCQELGTFIDHMPDVDETDHMISLAGYVRFTAIYQAAFKQNPPAHIWPELNEDGTGVAAACGGCGQGGPGSCSSCAGCAGQTYG